MTRPLLFEFTIVVRTLIEAAASVTDLLHTHIYTGHVSISDEYRQYEFITFSYKGRDYDPNFIPAPASLHWPITLRILFIST